MKINELLYKTPEMTEEKLLEWIKKINYFREDLTNRILEFYEFKLPIEECILKEWDKIQEKKSYLTKSQRDTVCGLVSYCLIQMVKDSDERE